MAKLSTSAFIMERLFFLDLVGTKKIAKYRERNLFFSVLYIMFVKMNNSEVIK